MLSRVAESIYWMARYIERADNIARFVDVNIRFNLDETLGGREQWEPLIQITGDDREFEERYSEFSRDNVIRFLTFDRDYSNSIISSLRLARENARTIREAIPSEAWEQLNETYLFVRDSGADYETNEGLADYFNRLKQYSHLYYGILDTTMSRNDGWHFANLGKMIERADKTSRLLDVKYFRLMPSVGDINTTLDDLQWTALLRSVSGFEMYRKRFHTITVSKVLAFLLRDAEFPRSIVHCLNNASGSLAAIAGDESSADVCNDRLFQLTATLRKVDVQAVIDGGMHEYIDNFQRRLNGVSGAINDRYFSLESFSGTQPQGSASTQS